MSVAAHGSLGLRLASTALVLGSLPCLFVLGERIAHPVA